MSLAALIVETRPLPNLIQIIEDHMKFLPDGTNLYVFGSEHVDLLLSQADFEYNFGDIGSFMNEAQYNLLLTSPDFWNSIKEENILIFQHDSRILRPGIEEFYKWDYIGASWTFAPYVGNGGFSFRHKSAMLHVLKHSPKYNQSVHGNEDCYYANMMNKLGYKMPPIHEADKFSVETRYNLGSFGCHAIEKHHSTQKVNRILNQYK